MMKKISYFNLFMCGVIFSFAIFNGYNFFNGNGIMYMWLSMVFIGFTLANLLFFRLDYKNEKDKVDRFKMFNKSYKEIFAVQQEIIATKDKEIEKLKGISNES